MTSEKKYHPPYWAEKVFNWYCNNELKESIAGDLEERFYDDVEKYGYRKAKINYWLNIFRFVNRFTLSRKSSRMQNKLFFMLPNYFSFGFRILIKQKLYSLIKIIGLSLAVAISILVAYYIHNEFSFDKSFPGHENIFRVERGAGDNQGSEENKLQQVFSLPFGPSLAESFPEVETYCRISQNGNLVRSEGYQGVMQFQYADKNFLDVLKYPMISGNRQNCLNGPNKVVLTRSTAIQFFGTTDCLGKTIELHKENGWQSYSITAVLENPASNISIDFKAILPISESPEYKEYEDKWNYLFCYLIIKVNGEANVGELKQKLKDFSPNETESNTYITPLAETHFDQKVSWWPKRNTKITSYTMGGIALIILVLASLNYMLMMLSTSLLSTKEFSIRKIVGARNGDLLIQSMIQSLTLSAIAFALGIILAYFILPLFNYLTDRNLTWDWKLQMPSLSLIFLLILMVTMLVSVFPVLKVSNINPLKEGHFSNTNTKSFLPQTLLVAQLFLSIFLLSGGYIMHKQLSFITKKDLGFDSSNILVVSTHNVNNINGKVLLDRFREKYGSLTTIKEVSGTNVSFGHGAGIHYGDRPDGTKYLVYNYLADWNYIQTMGFEVKEGRAFDANDENKNVIIINETFEKELREKDESVVGKKLPSGEEIIGVVKDFNFEPLTKKIEAATLTLSHQYIGEILVRVSQDEIPNTVSEIRQKWSEMDTGMPFEYGVLNDQLSESYIKYQRWESIVNSMAITGFLISCMGLFGLWGVKMSSKTKEITIRKVIGASTFSLLRLLSKEVILVTTLAGLISIPFTFVIINNWLESFAYRIRIDWTVFMIITAISILISLITVSFHTIKTALISPAKTLRSE